MPIQRVTPSSSGSSSQVQLTWGEIFDNATLTLGNKSNAVVSEPSEGARLSTEIDSAEIDPAEIDSAKIDSVEIDSAKIDSAEIDPTEIDSAEIESKETESAEIDFAEIDAQKSMRRNRYEGLVFWRKQEGILSYKQLGLRPPSW